METEVKEIIDDLIRNLDEYGITNFPKIIYIVDDLREKSNEIYLENNMEILENVEFDGLCILIGNEYVVIIPIIVYENYPFKIYFRHVVLHEIFHGILNIDRSVDPTWGLFDEYSADMLAFKFEIYLKINKMDHYNEFLEKEFINRYETALAIQKEALNFLKNDERGKCIKSYGSYLIYLCKLFSIDPFINNNSLHDNLKNLVIFKVIEGSFIEFNSSIINNDYSNFRKIDFNNLYNSFENELNTIK